MELSNRLKEQLSAYCKEQFTTDKLCKKMAEQVRRQCELIGQNPEDMTCTILDERVCKRFTDYLNVPLEPKNTFGKRFITAMLTKYPK